MIKIDGVKSLFLMSFVLFVFIVDSFTIYLLWKYFVPIFYISVIIICGTIIHLEHKPINEVKD